MGQSTLFGIKTSRESFLELCLEVQKKIPADIHRKRKKVIVIAGPTAVGKSELAMQLADKIGAEIVSADSMQVYRGMNIGTAKPTLEEQLQVPHHLIDLCSVKERFDVVQFYQEAQNACRIIHEREKIPIVVGGSGFYIHTLLYGPPAGPPPDPVIRQRLEEEAKAHGPELLYQRLQKLDPSYALSITPHDKHKIVRALEILEITGQKVSKNAWRLKARPQNFDFRCWFFNRPRESLYRRINKRCEKMIERGLIKEVEGLIPKGILDNPNIRSAIGYKQAIQYLESGKTEADLKAFLDEFQKASRHLAKRQLTWFRKEPLFHWLDLDLHDPETILDIIMRDYECWQWEI